MKLPDAVKKVAAVSRCPSPALGWCGPPFPFCMPKIGSIKEEGLYHPTVLTTVTALTPLSPGERARVLNFRLDWVAARRDKARARLKALGVREDLPETLPIVTTGSDEWPFGGTPEPARKEYRLRVGQALNFKCENTDTNEAAAALADRGRATVAASDPNAAALLLLQVRCMADIYARWEAASAAAAAVLPSQFVAPALTKGEMLARVLAYWRTEGDLSVPPEVDTLSGDDTPAGITKIPLPVGRRLLAYLWCPRFYMYSVTMLAPVAVVDAELSSLTPQEWTRDSLTVVLAGLDILLNTETQKLAERLVDPTFDTTQPFEWSARNRLLPPLSTADARTAASAAAARRLALVTTTKEGPASSLAYRGTVVGSAAYSNGFSGPAVEFASLAVEEGLRYLNRLTSVAQRFGGGAGDRVPEPVVYALFHLGHMAPAFLASACASAMFTRNPSTEAKELVASLPKGSKTHPLGAKLLEIRQAKGTVSDVDPATGKGMDRAVKLASEAWSSVLCHPLGTQATLTALSAYVTSADGAWWRSWLSAHQRQNVVRYRILYDYYIAAIGV